MIASYMPLERTKNDTQMKAMVYTKYGPPDVLRLKEVERPIPGDEEVLVKVHATTATAAEGMMRRGEPFWGQVILGLGKPRRSILGLEFAGEISSVGRNVERFEKGDQVYGFTGFRLGAYAEYVCMPEKGSLRIKPANTSYEEAAAIVDGASTALFFLKDKASIRPGQKVLINGASGSIGTSAVQLARYFGAEVTGVCSATNVELVRSLGADTVIDYTQEDFIRNGRTYDIIFDTVGKSSFRRCKGSLTKNGCYLPTVGLMNYVLALWTSIIGGRRVKGGMSISKADALVFIKDLVEVGKIRPVIDRRYPLEQTAEAHRYVEKGHKKGNVVITVSQDSSTGGNA